MAATSGIVRGAAIIVTRMITRGASPLYPKSFAIAAFPLEGGEASVSTTADTMIWGMEANFRMTPTVMGIKAIAKSGKNTAILGCKNVVFRMLKSARRKVPQTKMKTATGNIGLSNAESGGIKNPMMTPAARTVVPSTIFLPGR